MPFEHKNLTHIGEMAIFYVPVKCFKEYPRLESTIHLFLLTQYAGYTRALSPVKGFWTSNEVESNVFVDDNYEYKVAFKGRDRIPEFVDFLASICHAIGEEALYLEMGQHSYLISPSNSLGFTGRLGENHV